MVTADPLRQRTQYFFFIHVALRDVSEDEIVDSYSSTLQPVIFRASLPIISAKNGDTDAGKKDV